MCTAVGLGTSCYPGVMPRLDFRLILVFPPTMVPVDSLCLRLSRARLWQSANVRPATRHGMALYMGRSVNPFGPWSFRREDVEKM